MLSLHQSHITRHSVCNCKRRKKAAEQRRSFGVAGIPVGAAEQRRDLLEIVDDRYDKGSLLITSQVPVSRWHEVIGDMTIGDAIIDRVVHRAHRLELKGGSLRRKQAANREEA